MLHIYKWVFHSDKHQAHTFPTISATSSNFFRFCFSTGELHQRRGALQCWTDAHPSIFEKNRKNFHKKDLLLTQSRNSCTSLTTQPLQILSESCSKKKQKTHLSVYEWGTSSPREAIIQRRWGLWMNGPAEVVRSTALTVTCVSPEVHRCSAASQQSTYHMFALHGQQSVHLKNMTTCITTFAWICA